jgi:uncharacterized protein YukE
MNMQPSGDGSQDHGLGQDQSDQQADPIADALNKAAQAIQDALTAYQGEEQSEGEPQQGAGMGGLGKQSPGAMLGSFGGGR